MQRLLYQSLVVAFLFASAQAYGATYEETQKKHSWISFNRPAEKTVEKQKARADRLYDSGELKKASKAYHALVLTWPGSEEAPESQLRYAELLEKRGKLQDSFDEYQYLMDHYAGNFPYDDVLERQFAIAKATIDKRKGKILMFGGWKAPERAIPLFEKIVQNGPHWSHAAEAQFLIGKAYELSMQQDLAVGAYMIVQQRYPDSPYAAEASFSRAQCWYQLSNESRNDEETLEQAWTAVTTFLAMHASSDHVALAREMKETLYSRRAKVSYDKAIYYDRVAKKPQAALNSYRSFAKLFPNSEWTTLAQVRIEELAKAVETPK